MTDDTGPVAPSDGDLDIRQPPKILVPLAVLEGQTISEALVDFLAPAEVVILGYHVLPEQTSTEQASMQFEDRARQAVENVATAFRDAGHEAETRIAFTHDQDQTIERVAADVDATALLLPNPTGDVEDVLVPIRGVVDSHRLTDLVALLATKGDRSVTLWGLDGDRFDPERAVTDARTRLEARGLAGDSITTEITEIAGSGIRAIVDRSGEFDVIVMGEGEESLLTTLVGEDEKRIAEAAVAPVVVVRSGKVD